MDGVVLLELLIFVLLSNKSCTLAVIYLLPVLKLQIVQ